MVKYAEMWFHLGNEKWCLCQSSDVRQKFAWFSCSSSSITTGRELRKLAIDNCWKLYQNSWLKAVSTYFSFFFHTSNKCAKQKKEIKKNHNKSIKHTIIFAKLVCVERFFILSYNFFANVFILFRTMALHLRYSHDRFLFCLVVVGL